MGIFNLFKSNKKSDKPMDKESKIKAKYDPSKSIYKADIYVGLRYEYGKPLEYDDWYYGKQFDLDNFGLFDPRCRCFFLSFNQVKCFYIDYVTNYTHESTPFIPIFFTAELYIFNGMAKVNIMESIEKDNPLKFFDALNCTLHIKERCDDVDDKFYSKFLPGIENFEEFYKTFRYGYDYMLDKDLRLKYYKRFEANNFNKEIIDKGLKILGIKEMIRAYDYYRNLTEDKSGLKLYEKAVLEAIDNFK